MASTEDSKADGQVTGKLVVVEDATNSIPWDRPPFCWLNSTQQVQFKLRSETRCYTLGQKIWDTDTLGEQFFLVSGKVRWRETGNSKTLKTLQAGDWFGDLVKIPTQVKAIAASKEAIVVRWETNLWQEVSSPEIEQFWQQITSNWQPQTDNVSQNIAGYPFVPGINTAAACLTMAAQQLQLSTQLEWVQRQLRGQTPKHLVEAGEKLGLQIERVITTWQELPQLSFPALLLWRSELGENTQLSAPVNPEWIVVYGIERDRLIIANLLNPNQTCESVPRSIVEAAWDGQLWQVATIQQQDRFNLSWFLPAVWRYRRLLAEVLFASFTLQILGLATPLITPGLSL